MVSSDPPGLIAKPKSWTMDELARGKFKVFEFPVTIACDGSASFILISRHNLTSSS